MCTLLHMPMVTYQQSVDCTAASRVHQKAFMVTPTESFPKRFSVEKSQVRVSKVVENVPTRNGGRRMPKMGRVYGRLGVNGHRHSVKSRQDLSI